MGGLIFKVMGASALIAVGIKVLGPQLSLPPTPGTALILVWGPTVVVGVTLVWRSVWV